MHHATTGRTVRYHLIIIVIVATSRSIKHHDNDTKCHLALLLPSMRLPIAIAAFPSALRSCYYRLYIFLNFLEAAAADTTSTTSGSQLGHHHSRSIVTNIHWRASTISLALSFAWPSIFAILDSSSRGTATAAGGATDENCLQ